MIGATQLRHGDALPLEVPDRPNPVGPKELEAPHVHPCQHDEGLPRVHLQDKGGREVHGEVGLTGGEPLVGARG